MPNEQGPRGDSTNPADAAMPYWEQVVEDMAATADEYREKGWDALEIHPGDVQVRAGDVERTGFELLAPDNEFDPLSEAVDAGDGFDSANVYRANPSGTVYAVVALEDESIETALLFPVYYAPGQHQDLVEMVRSEGEVRTHVRPLDDRRIFTFTHDDPSLFLPDDA